jgi:hypothetical protein
MLDQERINRSESGSLVCVERVMASSLADALYWNRFEFRRTAAHVLVNGLIKFVAAHWIFARRAGK